MATGNPSLAARCTSCQTVFRVVPDQLRVSGGWVRCGRCAAVFNAAENLVELDDGVVRRSVRLPMPLAPPPDPYAGINSRPQTFNPFDTAEPAGVVATSDGAVVPAWADTDIRDDREDAGFVVDAEPGPEAAAFAPQADPAAYEPPAEPEPEPERSPPSPLPQPQPPPASVTAPAQVAPAWVEPSFDAQPALFERAPEWAEAPAAPAPAVAVESDSTAATPRAPSFVRSADRAAFWRLPQVRAGLASVALLAVAGLVAQVLIEYRDLAAARWPLLRPVLVAFCDVAGCRVDPARSIEGLAVESSGLLRIERSDRYRLSVTLRNRAGIDLALPALDLSLTDSQGKLLARRVLPLTEIGATQPTLPAGRELSLQATLRAAPGSAGDAVAGYTIELFYP